MRPAGIPLLLSLALTATAATRAALPTYSTFELQARSNIVDGYNLPALSSFNSKTPRLNDAGTIAFTLVSVGGGDAGLWVGAGGTGSVVYTSLPGRILENPSIDSAGNCAFEQADFLSDGIFVYDAASGITSQAIPPVTFGSAGAADITDAGDIGFRGSPFGGLQSWRLWKDGAETIYAAEGGDVAYLFTPSTNDAGAIAGKVRLGTTSGSSPDEIRVYDGPASYSVYAVDDDGDAGSPYVGFDNSLHLTDVGSVAFIADLGGGDRGVFLTDGVSTVTIATESGDAIVADISFFPPRANDSGLVVFRGTDDKGLDAIFVGDGTDLARVVGEHDLVPTDLGTARIDQNDGSVVFGGAVAINKDGDIAFNAALTPPEDDQVEWGSGMFVAYAAPASTDPPPVPDGDSVDGEPLRASLAANGVDVDITWDVVACPADDYNLFLGDLGQVASLAIDAAECGLGTAGQATFTPPAGSTFFLLAAESADGVESGHGLDGAGAPRDSDGIGLCGIVAQSLAGTCP